MSKGDFYQVSHDTHVNSPPAYTRHQHACLTLNWTDRIRLIRFPEPVKNIIRQAILGSWNRGLQDEKDHLGTHEFKLRGNPWQGQGEQAVDSRLLMISVLSALHHQGWYLLTSTDISKKQNDKDSLIFQLGVPSPPTAFFAVSFNERDKLRLIGAPPELISAVQQAIGTQEIQREEWVYQNTAYQFKLRGYPWSGMGDEAVTSRLKLLDLLDCFSAYGWQFHASIDMSIGYEGCDTDTWFFRRQTQ